MRKLGIVLAATLIAACTHSVEGTGDNKSGNGTGGLLGDTGQNQNDGKQTLGNDTNSTTPAGNTKCSIDTGAGAACNACASKSCCAEIDACNGNADCSALWSCLVKCGDTRACANDCVAKHPNGQSLVSNLYDCGNANCATECQ